MRRAIIAVLLLAALAGKAVAGPFEDGESAYENVACLRTQLSGSAFLPL